MSAQQSVPFAFTQNGFFARPHLDFVMTVFAAEQFKTYQPKNQKETDAVQALLCFVGHLTKVKYVRSMPDEIKPGDYPTSGVGVPNDLTWCLTVVLPAAFRYGFFPDHELKIASSPAQWGWEQAEDLLTHAATLRAIAKQLNCHLKITPIKKAAEWYNKLGSDFSVREPEALNDVGRTSGFASYVEGYGYIDTHGCANTLLNNARLFPNADEARAAADNAIAVELEMSIKRVCDPTNDQKLTDAVALLQKERLQETLEKAEIDVLRQRLKDLGYDTVENPTAKRKM